MTFAGVPRLLSVFLVCVIAIVMISSEVKEEKVRILQRNPPFMLWSQYNITCNADVINVDPAIQDNIYHIRLSRAANSSAERLLIYVLQYRNVILFPGSSSNWEEKNQPKDTHWKFYTPSHMDLKAVKTDSRFRRSIATVTVTIDPTTCDDAMEYFCKVTYGSKGGMDDFVEKSEKIVNYTDENGNTSLCNVTLPFDCKWNDTCAKDGHIKRMHSWLILPMVAATTISLLLAH